jgi:hypothetical protein
MHCTVLYCTVLFCTTLYCTIQRPLGMSVTPLDVSLLILRRLSFFLFDVVGDAIFLPSSDPPASTSTSPSTSSSSPPSSSAQSDGNQVEWVVVDILRSTTNPFPSSSSSGSRDGLDGQVDKKKDKEDMFSAAELKALASIKESKSGSFDHEQCGLRRPVWSCDGTLPPSAFSLSNAEIMYSFAASCQSSIILFFLFYRFIPAYFLHSFH